MKPYVKRNFFISELRNRSFFLSICKDFLRDDIKLFLSVNACLKGILVQTSKLM